ncbi:histidinol-phosphate aminotransferase [Virgibacillus halotolerans]|uniref:histidinol-phosphate transaminase n=1 Tax=Virgibacillus halotolerans TaxID=1071053 RepID=UPI0019607D59|nr:histidinol-phosphate transaminase [Virgibacillus halotolerans]MBM7599788.1 histidinol-phosphate aminotransferase [Virgibacillus halotolerans]
MDKFWSTAAKRSVPYVPGEQVNQPQILKLNTNENPYAPSPHVVKAIQSEVEGKLNLYPSPTADQLKQEIAAYYQLSSDHVFVGNGSDEVLAFSFMAFFEPGKAIRFPAISYSFYPVYAKLFDISYEEVPLQRDFSLPAEAFFQSDGGVIFPNPNAPTSVYLGLDAVKEIVENNPDQPVIIDEAYIDFAPESAVSLVETYDNLLVVQTMSKSRSLAGLRVGFALGNPHLIEALIRIKDSFNSYTLDRLALAGAEAAIKDTAYFKETTRKIVQTREWLIAELKKRGFYVLPSQTNFVFASHYNQSAEALYTILKDNGIIIRYFNQPTIDNYLRITIGTEDDMAKFILKLDEIL